MSYDRSNHDFDQRVATDAMAGLGPNRVPIMSATPYDNEHTRHSLAEACGIHVTSLDNHVKRGTCGIDKTKEKIPGIGTIFKGAQVIRFIKLMQKRKHYTRKSAPATPAP